MVRVCISERVNILTAPLFACSIGVAATTEAVAMMAKAVKMRVSMVLSWVCSRSIILVKVLVKFIQAGSAFLYTGHKIWYFLQYCG